jgi:glycerate 2-kinase
MTPRDLLLGAFQAAVEAVSAGTLLPDHLPAPPARGRILVVAAGKAAAAMAAVVDKHYPSDTALSGLAITRHGHGMPAGRIAVIEAGHPLPDVAGLAAAARLRSLVAGAGPDDQVLALLSGGGSSLLTLPAPGLTLADLQTTLHGLLNSGAPIADINCVRKHLSASLGGGLARVCRAPVTALLLSDVVGDDPSVIASGPFAPDPTTFADALAVLCRWHVATPEPVLAYLQQGAAGAFPDTAKPGAACFARITTRILGNGRTALDGAARWLVRQGVEARVLGDHFQGEARLLAREFAAMTRACLNQGLPGRPLMLLSGGEAQVTVRGRGRGGRNGEFLLALGLELASLDPADHARVHALAADTDGIDGSGENAGALLAPDSLSRVKALGLDAQTYLEDNDALGFFSALGDSLVTGPTRTNANDFRGILLT